MARVLGVMARSIFLGVNVEGMPFDVHENGLEARVQHGIAGGHEGKRGDDNLVVPFGPEIVKDGQRQDIRVRAGAQRHGLFGAYQMGEFGFEAFNELSARKLAGVQRLVYQRARFFGDGDGSERYSHFSFSPASL